ncbi:hypothetical protein LCGC14_0253870 [marine sediment metagenome]|uniref:Response regulatory domain-containing protein n=1 Tax=marine sediment metagenome TaxID=412755 RepID=A0A0F9WNZ7_9ZZZZ|nr:response regulator [Phycisphaerae bacterium]HDZ45305.1 response regulator [Phycisphaerae bacterium]
MNDDPKKQILFVEDNYDLLRSVVHCIRRGHPDWEWHLVPDIDEAWQRVCTDNFDCLVLDVMLPTSCVDAPLNEEGIVLGKWIRNIPVRIRDTNDLIPPPNDETPTNRRIPILILTSRDIRPLEDLAKQLDASISQRDEDPDETLDKLAKLMKRRR